MLTSTLPDNDAPPRRWWLLAGLLLVSLIVRGGALWLMRGSLQDDPDGYRQIAEAWRQTGVYSLASAGADAANGEIVTPTAFRPVLYPLLLGSMAVDGNVFPIAVAVLHLVFGLATVVLVYELACRMELGAVGGFAGLLVACDPILLRQSALVMTETLATLLAVLSLWLLASAALRFRYVDLAMVGASIGLATLCRPTFLPWLALVAIGITVLAGNSRERSTRAACLLLAAAVVLAPWTVRNYMVFGKPIVTTTHGGYTLWLANNDSFYDYLLSDKQTAWEAPANVPGLPDQQTFGNPDPLRELASDRLLKQAARETIVRRPAMFAYASLVRVGYLWSPLPRKTQPSESTYRVLARCLVGLWYVVVYALAIAGICKLRGRLWHAPWVWGMLLCVGLTLVHAVYWSNLRMRAPLMPVVALLAAAGVATSKTRPAPTLLR